MHIDEEIIAAIVNANTTENANPTPEEILMNTELTPEQEAAIEDAVDLAAQAAQRGGQYAATEPENDEVLNGIFDAYKASFDEDIRFVAAGNLASLANGAIKTWAWWEAIKQNTNNTSTIQKAEQRQARAASLYATLFGMIPSQRRPDIAGAIKAELTRDPNRDLTEEENLQATAKVLGVTTEELTKVLSELVKQAKEDPLEVIRRDLAKDHVPQLARLFQHDVAAYGPRALDLDEMDRLVDWTLGSLVGNTDRPGKFLPFVQREYLATARASSAVKKAYHGANHRMMLDAVEKLEGLSAQLVRLKRERDAAGYDVPDAWNAMH